MKEEIGAYVFIDIGMFFKSAVCFIAARYVPFF